MWTADVAILNNAEYTYSVWDNAAGDGEPLVTSGTQYGGWTIPSGVLTDGQTYYWSGTATADFLGLQGVLTTTPSAFLADSAVTVGVGMPDDGADYAEVADSPDEQTTTSASAVPQPVIKLASSHRIMRPAGTVQGLTGQKLKCNHYYSFSTLQATFSMQRQCDGRTVPWGFRLSGSFCSGATTSATEIGLQWWDHTTRTTGKNAKHKQWCDYLFHGTMSSITAGHQISYYDYVSFRKRVAGTPGTAWADASGISVVTNQR